MRSRLLTALVLALLLGLCLSSGAQEKPTSLSDARNAVEANLKTAQGRAYDAQIGKDFQQKYLEPVSKLGTTG